MVFVLTVVGCCFCSEYTYPGVSHVFLIRFFLSRCLHSWLVMMTEIPWAFLLSRKCLWCVSLGFGFACELGKCISRERIIIIFYNCLDF